MKSKHITFLKPGCKKHTLGSGHFFGEGVAVGLGGGANKILLA